MKEIDNKRKRGILAAVLVLTLCFTTFFPVVIYANKIYETDGSEVAEEPAEELPDYALLPDGTPNPAFTDADGSLFTVYPHEYAAIVAEWEEAASNEPETGTGLIEGTEKSPPDVSPASEETEGGGTASEDNEDPEKNGTAAQEGNTGSAQEYASASGGYIYSRPENFSASGGYLYSRPENFSDTDEASETDGALLPDGNTGAIPPAPDIKPFSTGIMPLAVDYSYFFHNSGQSDPYGSGNR